MKIIKRYLVKSFWLPFLVALGFIVFLLSLGSLFQLVELLVRNVLSGSLLLRYWFFLLLALLPYGFSLAALLGTSLTFSRFSQDHEFLAIKSLGIPFSQVLMPFLLLGLFLSIVNFFLVSFVQPFGLYQNRLLLFQARLGSPNNLFKPGSVITDFPGTVIFIPDKGSRETKVTIYQKDERLVRSISAGRIKVVQRHGQPYLCLEDGVIQIYQPQASDASQRLSFKKYLFPLPQKANKIKSPEPKLQEQSSYHLSRQTMASARAEQKRRISFAITPILFVFIGIPLGIFIPRSLWSVTSACGLVFGYYFALSGLDALVRVKPYLAPTFFLPDILLLAIGVWLLKRID